MLVCVLVVGQHATTVQPLNNTWAQSYTKTFIEIYVSKLDPSNPIYTCCVASVANFRHLIVGLRRTFA